MPQKQDLTTGSVAGRVIAFSLPIIFTNLLQALYNIADMAIVGYYLGPSGMSAINIGGLVSVILLVFSQGTSNGGGVVSSQLFVAGKKEGINHLAGTLLSFFSCLAVLLIVVVIIFEVPILHALGTPEEAYDGARSYLFICAFGIFFVYGYNVMAAIIRGVGNSIVPMIFVIITVALNIGLDFLFVGSLHMGPSGAAAATIISQFISMLLAAGYLYKAGLFDFRLTSFRIDKGWLSMALKIGLPQGMQFALTTFSFLLIAGLINQYGVVASAATGAVDKIGTFASLPAQALMVAIMTFCAQNLQKKQYRRILQAMLISMGISLAFTGTIFVISQLSPDLLLRIFTTDQAVIETGSAYLQVLTISYMIESLMFCMYGVVSGAGHTYYTFCCAILSGFVIRFALSWVFTSYTGMGLLWHMFWHRLLRESRF